MPPTGSHYQSLSKENRILIVNKLLLVCEDNKLPHGKIQEIANEYAVNGTTISRLWSRAWQALQNDHNNSPGIFSRKKLCGRLPIYHSDDIAAAVRLIPLEDRQTYRDISHELNIPKTTLHRIVIETGCLSSHTSAVKPSLKPENEVDRYLFCLNHVGENGSYKCMNHIIHIDEKWFYMTKVNTRYYLAKGEKEPHRTTRHKGHIEKVMFLAAVACPHYYVARDVALQQQEQYFDGKIGMWPIGKMAPARRASRNRPRGTLVWQNESLDRNLYRQMMVNLVLPAIKEKFPYHTKNVVVIQQDNATAHTLRNDPAILKKIASLQMNIDYINQPPNSPDLNICDLTFFRALQTMQFREKSTTSVELIRAVLNAFEAYQPTKLRDGFLTLQGCMNCILDCNGGNDYKIPHMGKRALERQGILPTTIEASQEALDFWTQPAVLLDNDDDNDDENDHDNE